MALLSTSLSDPLIDLWEEDSTRGDNSRERTELPQAPEDSKGGICGCGSTGQCTVYDVGES
jgi:hypothetical protein